MFLTHVSEQGSKCRGMFQCVDGSCIEWSSTCKKTSHCPEASHNPSICGKTFFLKETPCTKSQSGCQNNRIFLSWELNILFILLYNIELRFTLTGLIEDGTFF
jgi:hypothetical protein